MVRGGINGRIPRGLTRRRSPSGQTRSLALVALSLANPTAKRLGIAADLARDRRDRGPLRAVLGLVIKHHPNSSLADLR
jgi:hypothetical protein